ncbi:hypothetical protein ECE50_008895 [Chitinophaga sp. Mgbs1]|uniref:Methylamine utilisation protein MauE domain-containing protein n=1 Tax=Chitinophaga solisilvae TaxID=1233460 RepID=A0A3S1D2N0_9BACT|nr:hypothetical protein [Chitinophaga solisilvae]
MQKNKVLEIIASPLICLFTYAGLSKLIAYQTFINQLGQSPFISKYAATIAWAIPAIELLIVLLLLFKRYRSVGLYASFFLMALFTGYIFAMLRFSEQLPCSCGGVLAVMNWQQHLWFNIFFTCLALSGVIIQERKENASPAVG